MPYRSTKETPDYMPAETLPIYNERRHHGIEKAAYFIAQRRGFEPGHEQEDWLAAEHARNLWERGCGRDPHWP